MQQSHPHHSLELYEASNEAISLLVVSNKVSAMCSVGGKWFSFPLCLRSFCKRTPFSMLNVLLGGIGCQHPLGPHRTHHLLEFYEVPKEVIKAVNEHISQFVQIVSGQAPAMYSVW